MVNMPYYLVENRAVRIIIKARDSEAAVRKFMGRYPVIAETWGVSVTKWFGPPYFASPRGAPGGGRR